MKKKWNFLRKIVLLQLNFSVGRTGFLLLLILFTAIQAKAWSQSRITVGMQGATIDEVIKEVRETSGYRFLYRVEEVNRFGKRDIDVRDAKVSDFLEQLLQNTDLTYEVENEVIIIRPGQKKAMPQVKVLVVSGKVTDEKNMALPGATVLLKGTSYGVVTDANGKFRMEVPEKDSVMLLVSFVGMETRQVFAGKGQTEILVSLNPDVKEMQEVVVTGYGNVRKTSFTGNSVTVSKEELMAVSKSNVIKALQTFDPSFRIQTNNDWGSDPNALPEMYVRGRSGIGGVKELDRDPLTKSALKDNPNLPTFIMDGFQISVEQLYDMDPNRIESITILKDAAATALYGSRAANGVVVITTVAPKPGKLNVSYNFTGDVTIPDLSDYNLMNASEKLETEVAAGVYKDLAERSATNPLAAEQEYYAKLASITRGVDTYWLSKPLQTSFNHKHSLNIDGGSDNFRFGIQLNYNNEDGVMKESFRNRAGAGVYLDYRIGSFQLKNMVTYTNTRSQESPYGSFSDYTSVQPYDPYKDDNGNYLERLPAWDGRTSNRKNPLYESTLANYDKAKYEEFINNLGINWNIVTELLWKTQFSLTRKVSENERFLDPLSAKNAEPQSAGHPSSGELHTNKGSEFYWDLSSTLSYNRSIEKHHINVLAGVNARSVKTKNLSAFYRGFPSGALNSPNYAEEIVEKPVSSDNSTRLIGFLGTLNYSYNDIYLMDASVRMDGSSEFGSDKRFAPFWSLGAGINIHNYGFMKGLALLDLLKVRASYGETGKVNFPPYVARTIYQMFTDGWYKTGFGGTLKALGNSRLTWETTNTWDAGVELSLWKRLLYMKATWYQKKTVDLVNSVTIPSSTGFTTYMDNIGEVENKGYELEFRSEVVKRKDLFVALFANLAHNKNKILKISESLKAYNDRVKDHFANSNRFDGSNTKPFTQYVEGGSLTSIWGVPSLGIDPATGNEIFVRPDGSITSAWNTGDQVVLGDSEPKVQGTFGVNATWKNLSLYMTFMYEAGGQIYNSTLVDKVEDVNVYTSNVDKRVLTERWKNPGDKARYRKLVSGVGGSIMRTRPTSRFVEDNNVLTLNSVSLGYDFDAGQKWMKTIGLSLLRFEIGANDLCHWSSVKVERGLNYPYARSFNFSLKAAF